MADGSGEFAGGRFAADQRSRSIYFNLRNTTISHFFIQAFLYLVAAVIAVPLAKRLGLGSALGYLLTGIVIGPFMLGMVGEEGQDVMHFAEFGVVMMLFIVGLELKPSLLWRMRVSILGLGGAQVVLTSLVIGLIAY